MDVKNQVVKFSRALFFILFSLMIYSYPGFCEDAEIPIHEEPTNKEYKNYLNEFHRAFGKQMEKEFGLKWIEGGFIHNFSSDDIEFYAHRLATLEEARALELLVLNRLAEEIRADAKLLSYLDMFSLSPESMGASIAFVNLNNWEYNDGSIDKVYFNYTKRDNKRYLRYTSTDPFSDYSAENDEAFDTNRKESFEDAVKINTTTFNLNPSIHNEKEFENELNKILISFEEEMEEKHGLFFRSSGWMVAGNSTPNISEIRTKCIYRYPVDCRDARALMLLATEKLLAALNSSEILRPHLKDNPFPASRVKIRMLFRKNNYFIGNTPYYDGSMESAVLNENIITYYHHIPNTKDSDLHDRVIYARESYHEAQKALAETSPLTLWELIIRGVNNLIFNFTNLLESAGFIFFIFLLFIIINPQSWLFFILPIIVFILRRRRRVE